MEYTLDEKIYIKNAPQQLVQWCAETLTFANPEYAKKKEMGMWTGNVPREIVLYEKHGKDLVLPFGVAKEVYKLCVALGDVQFTNRIQPIRQREYGSNINTYDYQENAVQSVLQAKNGILVAPCGSGKTQMGLEIIARVGGKALWLTHTQDLLVQSMERAKACFDLPANEYGTITAGKVDIGNTITFATVQTMANIDLASCKREWDVVVVDEVQHCVGTPTKLQMFYKVVSALSCRYKIGLTATPHRADGLTKCMFAVVGDIAHTVPLQAVEDKTCPVEVHFVNTGYTPDTSVVLASDGTILYSSLISDLSANIDRNKVIVGTVKNLHQPTLVLCDRVEHLHKLAEMLRSAGCVCAVIDGRQQSKKAKEQRKQTLADLNGGKIEIVLATYKLAKEGLDCPNLRYIVLATPQKDKTTVVQSCGRVARKSDGKDKGVVIDFVDNFGMLQGFLKKRKSYYKQLKYSIF